MTRSGGRGSALAGSLLLGALAAALIAARFEVVIAAMLVGLAAMAFAGARRPRRREIASLATAVGLVLALNILLVRGQPLVALPAPFHASREGLAAGALLAMRLTGAAIAMHGLRFAWPGERAADELAGRLRPLERVGLPVRTVRAVVGLALRFAPLVAAEAERIVRLQDQRAGGPPRTRRDWLERRRALMVPLLVCTLERAERVALAMEARHYRVRPLPRLERSWPGEIGGLALAGLALAWRT